MLPHSAHAVSPLLQKHNLMTHSHFESRCFLSSCVTWIKSISLISIISPGKERKRKRSRSGCMCSCMLARQLCIIKAFWSLPRLSPGIRSGNQTCWKSSQKLELWGRTEERSRFVWFSFAALLVLLQASRLLCADPLSSKYREWIQLFCVRWMFFFVWICFNKTWPWISAFWNLRLIELNTQFVGSLNVLTVAHFCISAKERKPEKRLAKSWHLLLFVCLVFYFHKKIERSSLIYWCT